VPCASNSGTKPLTSAATFTGSCRASDPHKAPHEWRESKDLEGNGSHLSHEKRNVVRREGRNTADTCGLSLPVFPRYRTELCSVLKHRFTACTLKPGYLVWTNNFDLLRRQSHYIPSVSLKNTILSTVSYHGNTKRTGGRTK
jgi:hypothetical protein